MAEDDRDIEALSGRLLALFAPEGVGQDGDWQQRKSAQTRIAILEAAIDCLSSAGYARTTTQLIAKRARISRGAMLHHYATKQDLVASLIDYVMYKRMQSFIVRIRTVPDSARVNQAGIELYWQTLLSREFTAYLELSLAARTDPELHAIWLPRASHYDRVEREQVLQSFPEWAAHPQRYLLAMDFCIACMEGLLLNRDIWSEPARRALLRKFVAMTLLKLRDGEMPMPDLIDE